MTGRARPVGSRRALRLALAATTAALLAGAAAVMLLNRLDEDPVAMPGAATAMPAGPGATDGGADTAEAAAALVTRGAYLARAGNCAGCHTRAGGAPYAGGRPIDTPFGRVFAPNLTPDPQSGLGRWSASEFWRAMHNGRSRDGRLLYPAFPYPNYTLVTRADSDAIFAFLRTLPAAPDGNLPHRLRFPYDTQAALAVWRALWFRPARFEPDAARDAAWNRGSYLVRGLGHCGACHDGRNLLGAPVRQDALGGGLIPEQNWYAPALNSRHEAGVAHWDEDDVVALLATGVSRFASALGPMATVVRDSTQHLDRSDLRAIASYLRTLPAQAGDRGSSDAAPAATAQSSDARGGAVRDAAHDAARDAALEDEPDARSGAGARLYETHCAQCHGDRGEGVAGIYPRLAGNRTVTIEPPANLVRIVLGGGFPPSTAGNPRPFGMPPFATVLDDGEIAAVLSHVRAAWGNAARPLSAHDVNRYRGAARP